MIRVVIVGASGFGGEAAWVVRRMAKATGDGMELLGFCDDAPEKQSGVWCGLPLLGPIVSAACGDDVRFHVAIGHNATRERLTALAMARGWRPLTLIDPTAVIAPDARMDDGCYIGAGAVVSCGAVLGAGVIVNLQATVGHDATLAPFAHVCPGARVAGGCCIGTRALLGSNAVVIPGLTVGADATVGATAAALRDIPDGGSVLRLSRGV